MVRLFRVYVNVAKINVAKWHRRRYLALMGQVDRYLESVEKLKGEP